ncbi:MAG: glutamate--tRNA ligase [Nitrososphaerota archaeon]
MELEKKILKWALKNALDYQGKADKNAVISKVIREDPSLKEKAREIVKIVEEVVARVNLMSLNEQKALLEEIAPELIEYKPKVEEKKLPPLPHALRGRVVTRLPPEPSGYMHIGHAMSGILNYVYAKMYDGKIWLRFEDTDPRKVKLEYYESFRKGYRWLGIEWDYEKNNSDDMELFYEYAEKLINKGYAYICFCKQHKIKVYRREGIKCEHRDHSVEENIRFWNNLLDGKYGEGEAVLRLLGDMSSTNTTMRDPSIFRIVKHPHPLHGSKYIVWPLYDYAVAIEDYLCNVTHVLRTSEFALRDELQNYIRKILGMDREIHYIEYSRFEFKGTPVSKRKLRKIIEMGLASSWDDPRFPTVEGLIRRGIMPEAIREFTLTQTGFTYVKREYDWSLLYAYNRRVLDPTARRLFFVPDPVELIVEGLKSGEIALPYHPTNKELGYRKIRYSNIFYISKSDVATVKPGTIIRLKYLANFRIVDIDLNNNKVVSEYVEGGPSESLQIIQWVPKVEYIPVRVLVPEPLYLDEEEINNESLKIIDGYGESNIIDIRYGEIVQFERFGFCRRDSEKENIFIKSHE